MQYRVLDVYDLDCHMIVCVEHFYDNGESWHIHNYRFQGREGLRQKKAINDRGEVLMDNGQPAPTTPADYRSGSPEPYLPPGRTWQMRPGLRMTAEGILDVIRSRHQKVLATGWNRHNVDIVTRLRPEKISQRDHDGCTALVSYFSSLKEYSE